MRRSYITTRAPPSPCPRTFIAPPGPTLLNPQVREGIQPVRAAGPEPFRSPKDLTDHELAFATLLSQSRSRNASDGFVSPVAKEFHTGDRESRELRSRKPRDIRRRLKNFTGSWRITPSRSVSGSLKHSLPSRPHPRKEGCRCRVEAIDTPTALCGSQEARRSRRRQRSPSDVQFKRNRTPPSVPDAPYLLDFFPIECEATRCIFCQL